MLALSALRRRPQEVLDFTLIGCSAEVEVAAGTELPNAKLPGDVATSWGVGAAVIPWFCDCVTAAEAVAPLAAATAAARAVVPPIRRAVGRREPALIMESS